jgi:hypothetical protein
MKDYYKPVESLFFKDFKMECLSIGLSYLKMIKIKS